MGKLDGKTAIVTGAGSGIGRATALLFGREGAGVVCADWHDAEAETVAEAIRGAGGQAVSVKTDVSKEADVQKMIATATERFGRLDVIFNNAGIEGEQAPTADCTIENFDRVISVNLRGVFLGTKFAIAAMLQTGGGSVINNASVAGLVGFANIPAYCASKGGVIQLSKGAALEYAKQGVRVNAICPGVIDTAMVQRFVGDRPEVRKAFEAVEPVGRFGTAEEVAALVLFLASDESSFCTGGAYPVDGGFVAA
jgi:NAD(P)-dependent dehydrogenase (short-subunit alcohol dehydrogenase family)